MKRGFSAVFTAVSAAAAALLFALSASAAEATVITSLAADNAGGETWMLTDSSRATKRSFPDGAALMISAQEPASALYLVWDAPPPQNGWTLLADGQPVDRMSHGFLHEYVPLDCASSILSLSWEGAATLCEVTLLGEGEPPDWAQVWQMPEGAADLLLFPTHADDEHLFFGGILPLYAADGRYEIQVAYMVSHNGEPYRPHELLDGLWAVGVRRYPVIPDFPDVYSDSLEHAKTVYDEEKLLAYQIKQILSFTPQVIVGHDLGGEYGHGGHMLNARTLLRAVEEAASLPDGWDTPKTYLHLHPENSILLDYDTPLAAFDGKTAFEMACEGFSLHVSQQSYFSVEQSGPCDCRRFGLARTAVGPDERGGDLFEHLIPYCERISVIPHPSEAAANPAQTIDVQSAVKPAPAPVSELTAYLPEAKSNFIFAVIGTDGLLLGIAAALGLILALVWLELRRKKGRRR